MSLAWNDSSLSPISPASNGLCDLWVIERFYGRRQAIGQRLAQEVAEAGGRRPVARGVGIAGAFAREFLSCHGEVTYEAPTEIVYGLSTVH